jgi:DNA-binding CsgD family transcriptional regulator
MSYTMTKALHDARLAGQLSDLKEREMFVLLWMAETCRTNTRVVSITMAELAKLTGRSRRTISTTVQALEDKGRIRQTRGNQHQASSYEILACADFCTSTDAEHAQTSAQAPEECMSNAEEVHEQNPAVHEQLFAHIQILPDGKDPDRTHHETSLRSSHGDQHATSLRSLHVDQTTNVVALSTWLPKVTSKPCTALARLHAQGTLTCEAKVITLEQTRKQIIAEKLATFDRNRETGA